MKPKPHLGGKKIKHKPENGNCDGCAAEMIDNGFKTHYTQPDAVKDLKPLTKKEHDYYMNLPDKEKCTPYKHIFMGREICNCGACCSGWNEEAEYTMPDAVKDSPQDTQEWRKDFEENLLDGDDVYNCGKAMLSAEEVYEYFAALLEQEKRKAYKKGYEDAWKQYKLLTP